MATLFLNKYSIAFELLPYDRQASVLTWLQDTYGPESCSTWYMTYDFDRTDLSMNNEIYSMYVLRWKEHN